MDMSIPEAYEILQLTEGANTDDIVQNFKKIALECHPDKHSQTDESFQNFHKICGAFLRLTKTDEKERKKPLTNKRMFQLFEEVFFGEAAATQNGYPYFNPDSCDEDDSDDGCGDEDDHSRATGNNSQSSYQNYDTGYGSTEREAPITTEEANKNADILVAEEEKERKKAEKRKAKKKKRKEKKKQEKELNKQMDKKQIKDNSKVQVSASHSTGKNKVFSDSDDESKSEEELDPSSAFALASAKTKTAANVRNSKPEKFSVNKDYRESPTYERNSSGDDNSIELRSKNLAIRGNDMASIQKFQEAIELFSEAIRLNPKDFRFYGNRSYCHDKLNLFEKALKDAEIAIQLDPSWPKNYYRKGRALAGLKRYNEAEAAFEHVMKLDKNCEDAEQELLEVRTRRIMELGFTRSQALKSLEQHKSVQEAIDSLLDSTSLDLDSLQNDVSPRTLNEVYMSDDETFPSPVLCPRKISTVQASDIKMDPNNPEGLSSLWIGNVSKDMKEKTMRQLFSNYGSVVSLRLLPEKFCAFVNFADKHSASRAMKELQGYSYCGQRLLLKFPEKMGTTSTNSVKKIIAKSNSTVVSYANKNGNTTKNSLTKPSGPVKGGECYFWRTTGCSYGDKCRNKHILANKGIDLKSWHL